MAQQAEFDSIFDQFAQSNSRFAISSTYVIGDSEPITKTAGTTESDGAITVTDDARWHIGSISKTFTATLVMRLAERGRLNLDVPIERYLPAYRKDMHADWKASTLKELLSHTSGLPANAPRSIMRRTSFHSPYEDRRNVLSAMWGEPLGNKVGTFTYSNIGYVVAGVIVEEVTGRTWEELILSEIAEPFDLKSLGFGAPQEHDAPRGHRSILGFKYAVAPESSNSDNPGWMGPAGSIHLSITDLARWGQLHVRACQGRLPNFLSQSSCQMMQSPVTENYGLGWVVQSTEKNGPIIWHNGSNTMWYAVLSLMPDKDLVVAVATNVFASDRVDEMVRELSAALADNVL